MMDAGSIMLQIDRYSIHPYIDGYAICRQKLQAEHLVRIQACKLCMHIKLVLSVSWFIATLEKHRVADFG